ncbi:MAG: UvrD-helicase domain-containing protein [Isosphaeraceae bacterium]|jgi:ATP-dependent helicase/nuclease subunit A
MNDAQVSGPPLTREQHEALEVAEASVALRAGAGCGKTLVLTERYRREIEGQQGRPLGSLVALTFTEKAARELRQRIRRLCRARLRAGHEVERWGMVLRALEAAPIGTFHEFCAHLLRTHAIEIGIDPEFTVFDAAIAGSLRDEAVRITLRRLLAGRNEDLIALASNYGLAQIREAMGLLVAMRTTGDLDEWTKLTVEQVVDRWQSVWNQRGRFATLLGLSSAASRCRQLLSRIDASHSKLKDRLRDMLDRLPELESGRCSDELLEKTRELARINDLRGSDVWPSGQIKDDVKNEFEGLRDKIKRIQAKLLWDKESTRESARTSLHLARLAAQVRRSYESIKEGRSGLDFDDLLVKTHGLLRERPEILASDSVAGESDSIEFVLVDEFQDTDRVQTEILEMLAGAEFQRGRMFVVGDVRQSIYRFRGAEPGIFDQWRDKFPDAGRKNLTENFRSVPGVIHFVNALFAEHFAEAGPGEEPADQEEHRLVPVRKDLTGQPAVTFVWALPPEPTEPELAEGVKTTAHDRRENEARTLARWIGQQLEAGWTILDRNTREPRLAHAGDIAFLFRAMTDVAIYERALADAGFDYHTLGGSAFYAQQEIHDVINLLSIVEDPCDEVALAGALRSPFFSLSDNGLFWLARAFPGGLIAGLERSEEILQLSQHDRNQTARARSLLARWREIKDRVGLAAIVTQILDESGFEASLVCEFLGARKLANARKLLLIAREFDRQGGFTLADLVARLRGFLDEPPREELAAATEEESTNIRLMSIHQAKGLEFPIVVIPDLNRETDSRTQWLGFHPDLGLVVRPVAPLPTRPGGEAESLSEHSLGWLTFRAIEEDENRREAIRLFYVAATRARDHLILSSGLPADPRPESPAMQLLWDRFDWQTGLCLAGLPETWPVPRIHVTTSTPPAAEGEPARPPLAQRLSAIERAIVETEIGEPEQVLRPSPRPGLIDFDPARRLSPRAARLDRLIRAMIADKGLLRGEPLAEACARVGARQAPAASTSLIAEAVTWLEPWLATPVFQELRDAARARRPIERNLEWTIAWPLDENHSTVLRGCSEAIYRDQRGRWRPVIVSTAAGDSQAERLRLMLSGVAALQRGFDPGGPGWWVHLGTDDNMLVDVHVNFNPAAIGQTLEEWLRASDLAADCSMA